MRRKYQDLALFQNFYIPYSSSLRKSILSTKTCKIQTKCKFWIIKKYAIIISLMSLHKTKVRVTGLQYIRLAMIPTTNQSRQKIFHVSNQTKIFADMQKYGLKAYHKELSLSCSITFSSFSEQCTTLLQSARIKKENKST